MPSTGASLLTYHITSNHVHRLTSAIDSGEIGQRIQQAAGEFARGDNRRKGRGGAFWEGRHHATMVDSRVYLWECLGYIERNMVRCGVVGHPADSGWSGYRELMRTRRRNRLLDQEKLLWLLRCEHLTEFGRQLDATLGKGIIDGELKGQAQWTESIAVAERADIEAIEEQVGGRQQGRVEE